MKPLMLCTLTLFLATTALTGGVVAYVRTHSENPLKAYGFDVCDGKICLYQITPGVTTWLEAENLLRRISTNVSTDKQFGYMSGSIGDNLIYVWPSTNGVSIDRVYFWSKNRNTFPSLTDLLANYGAPCVVGPGLDADHVTLHYPAVEISFILYTDRLILSPDIDFVMIRAAPNSRDDGSVYCDPYEGQTRWLGLTTMNRYFEAGLSYPY